VVRPTGGSRSARRAARVADAQGRQEAALVQPAAARAHDRRRGEQERCKAARRSRQDARQRPRRCTRLASRSAHAVPPTDTARRARTVGSGTASAPPPRMHRRGVASAVQQYQTLAKRTSDMQSGPRKWRPWAHGRVWQRSISGARGSDRAARARHPRRDSTRHPARPSVTPPRATPPPCRPSWAPVLA